MGQTFLVQYLVSRSYSSKDIQQSTFLLMMALPVDRLARDPEAATLRPWGYRWRLSISSLPL